MMCQDILKQATEELERRAGHACTLQELKDLYCEDELSRTMLIPAGGGSPGWRLARGLVKHEGAKHLRTAEGISKVLRGESLLSLSRRDRTVSGNSLATSESSMGDETDDGSRSPSGAV